MNEHKEFEADLSGTVRLHEGKIKEVEDFIYLGSTFQSNRVRKKVKKNVQVGWNRCTKVPGVSAKMSTSHNSSRMELLLQTATDSWNCRLHLT